LRGDEEFAGEGVFGGAAAQGFFSGDFRDVGIIIFLRDVREDEIARVRIETIGIGEIFADRMIGKVAGARENALLDDPRVGSDLEHIEIVIGFEDEAIGLAEMDFDEFGHVAEIGADGGFAAIGAKGEADGVGGVVGNGKGVNVNITNHEALAGLNGLHTAQAFAKGVGKNALESGHGGFGDVERSFPEAENLREAVAMIGMLVGDEDSVEMIDVALNGGEAGESFAFAEAGVNEDAGAVGFQQGKIAGAARRQDGNTQTDEKPPEETLKMMAERKKCVNAQKAAT